MHRITYYSALLTASLLAATASTHVSAQSAERWYQIELSIFTHEDGGWEEERWLPGRLDLGFPEQRLRRLTTMLDALDLEDWTVLDQDFLEEAPGQERDQEIDRGLNEGLNGGLDESLDLEPDREPSRELQRAPDFGPQAERSGDFKLPDMERDAFVMLPASEHNFQQTNTRLEGSSMHRLLYHAAWRQPVRQQGQAIPLAIAAGRNFPTADGLRHELEGSIRIYFNPPESRVVLDNNLWLSEFGMAASGMGGTSLWNLPALPEVMANAPDRAAQMDLAGELEYAVRRIIPMRQSRDMRSNEYHYLDHPALGIIVEVFPYEPPLAPTSPLPF